VRGLFLAMTIAFACTAAQAKMPQDDKYFANEAIYIRTSNEVHREYGRTMAQCRLDTDQYMSDQRIYHGRYGLCMNAAGWPSPYLEDVVNPTAALVQEVFNRVREKWEASGKDVQWLDAYRAEYMAKLYPDYK
jgi:hypothetical protein